MVAETVWDSSERQKYLSETIVEHLYRQGMLSVAEDLCQVNIPHHRRHLPSHGTSHISDAKQGGGGESLLPSVLKQPVAALCVLLLLRPAGVWRGHRHEHEAALSGAQPHPGGTEDAGPPASTGVCGVALISLSLHLSFRLPNTLSCT